MTFLQIMKKTIHLLAFLLTAKMAFSQQIPINIRIAETNQKPIIGATVRLISRLEARFNREMMRERPTRQWVNY